AFQPPPVIPSLPTLGGTGAVSPFNFGGTGFPGTPGSTSPGLLPTVATGTAAGIPISAILLALALGVAAVGAGGMRRFAEMATTAPAAERCELEKT
ncbi:MAG TPA: hypothetical protein VF972_05515, partial [Actinomycetota bacterium]